MAGLRDRVERGRVRDRERLKALMEPTGALDVGPWRPSVPLPVREVWAAAAFRADRWAWATDRLPTAPVNNLPGSL